MTLGPGQASLASTRLGSGANAVVDWLADVFGWRGRMVPAAGFEPATYGLQNRCTTTVLSRQSAGDYNRAGGSAGSGSAERSVPGRDSAWVSGGASRLAAGGLPALEPC